MADPIDELTAATPPKSRSKQWAEKGVTKDVHVARQRVAASRKSRKKRIAKAVLSFSVRGTYVAAVEAISDRFDVSRGQVMEQAVIDLITHYGTTDEIAAAQIPPPSPFQRMARPAPPVKAVYETVTSPVPQHKYLKGVLPSVNGAPLPQGGGGYAGLYDGDIESETEDATDPSEPSD